MSSESVKEYFRSIRFRIWITFVAFSLGTMGMMLFFQLFLTPIFYSATKTNEYKSCANTIKRHISAESWDPYSIDSLNGLRKLVVNLATSNQLDIIVNFPSINNGTIYATKSGGTDVLTRNVSDNIRTALAEAKDGTIITKTDTDNAEGIILATYAKKEGDIIAYLFIFGYTEPIGTTLSIINALSLICSNVVLVGACIISIMISSHIANPLVKISKNADKLITGDFHMDIGKTDYDEIATLTKNLNAASEEINKTGALRKDLMANVSHDLRTPLTMIKAYAEMIRDLSGDNPEKREKHLQVIIDETDRLTLLVNDILNLSKLESGVMPMELLSFDFSEDLKDIISRFSLLDDMKDYQVKLEAEDGIVINADRQKIEQVVYNLVNNAINYIGEDKLVTVRLYRKKPNTARFEVADRGLGIPPEKLPYIWDRYYKIDRSENYKRSIKGTGLGLSIVKGILTGHNFLFGCDSVLGQGSVFWFEFEMPVQMPQQGKFLRRKEGKNGEGA
ncbi:MAG: HAMP domain-containing histidine kinase [Ruminiclostridium sp.]|nr:HAMP domain-containing histidine kinase [Ruminiclostridium sp.]